MVIRLALLYGMECLPIKKSHIQIIRVVEMRMIHWMRGHTRFDKIRIDMIRSKIRMTSIDDKIREARLT